MESEINTSLLSLTTEHRLQIIEMDTEEFGDDAMTLPDLETVMSSQNWSNVVLLDVPSNQIAGYAFCKAIKNSKILTIKDRKFQVAVVFWLARLVVRKNLRGRGVGKSLHDGLVEPGYVYRCHVPEPWTHAQIWMREQGWVASVINKDHYLQQSAYTFLKYEEPNTD